MAELPDNIEVQELLDAASSAMAIIDKENNILAFNEEFTHLYPTCKGNLLNIVPLSNADARKELSKAVAESNKHFAFNLSHQQGFAVHLSFKPLKKQSGSKLFLCSASKDYQHNDSYFLQQLLNNIPDSIFIKDEESRFLVANSWVAQVMNVNSPADLIGKNDFDFHPKKLAEQYYNDEQDIIHSGKSILNKHEKVFVDGETRWYSTTKVPLYDEEGRIRGIMGIGRDVTSSVKKTDALEKAKQEAEKADKLKSTFLANLSHEIRTPLNGIIGFSQFLRQKKGDEAKRLKYLDIIHRNGQQLLMLINDIIDISMIESNQLTIKKNVFRINPVLEQLRANFEHLIHEKSLPVKIYCYTSCNDGDDKIFTDDFRLNQVLNNLLINAIKFTPKGKIELGYSAQGGMVEFYVKDSGIGIEPKQQKEIFSRFRQADESATRNYGGTGLGLAICKGLVQLLGGRIWVESEFGKGSIFKFTIPFCTSGSG